MHPFLEEVVHSLLVLLVDVDPLRIWAMEVINSLMHVLCFDYFERLIQVTVRIVKSVESVVFVYLCMFYTHHIYI